MEFKYRRSIAERDADTLRRDQPRISLLNQLLHHDLGGAPPIEDTEDPRDEGQAGVQPDRDPASA